MALRYGYGQSKPQVNNHQANSEYVTTVVKEISRMTINNHQKPGYGYGVGDALKNKVCKEEVVTVEEKNSGGYKAGGYQHGDAVDYKHEKFEEKKNSGYDAYHGGYDAYHGGGGAVQKLDYKHETFEEKKNNGYLGGVQKHGYKQEAFEECVEDGYGSNAYHGGDMHKYGYGYQKDAFGGAKADASGGYGYGYGGAGAKQSSNTYKQQAAYGGAITAAVQQHPYQDACGEADAAAAYGGYYGGGALQTHGGGYKPQPAGYGYGTQKHGYTNNKQDVMYGPTAGGYNNYNGGGGGAYHYNKAHGSAAKTGFAGGHHYGHAAAYDNECEESDDESDCEDAAAFGHKHGAGAGGVHSYEAYAREEKHGGGVHRYEAYERHETTSHEGGYAGGAAGYGAGAPPRKNHFFF